MSTNQKRYNSPASRICALILAVTVLLGGSFAGQSLCGLIAAAEDVTESAYVPKAKLPTSSGIEALRNEFESGTASEAYGYQLDYTYYSPVGTNDTQKYPIVVFLHGVNHGSYPGSQLDDSYMPYWASEELQERFDGTEGAFILLPRSPEDKSVYWSNSLIEPLYMVIRDFIREHGDNVDTTRIYISGSSQGGAMCWKMIKAYPGMFAAAFPLAATQFNLNANDVKMCSQTAFWLISSRRDPIVNYFICTMRVWNNLLKYNDHPENCRLSTFTEVTNPDGSDSSDNHHLANVITYDLFTMQNEPYPNMTVIDGAGNTIDMKAPYGLIKWMSAIRSEYDGHEFTGSGTADQGFITSSLDYLLYRLFDAVVVVQRLLGL